MGVMLTKKQAAEILGIPVKSLETLVKKRRIPYHQYGGRYGRIRFSEEDIRDFLEASRVEAVDPKKKPAEEPTPKPTPKLKPPKVPKYEHLGI